MNELTKKYIDFKLKSAQFFLDQIPLEVPLEIFYDEKNNAERNSQCFLFFALGSIDVIYGIINEKLNLKIPTHLLTEKKLINSLSENRTEKAIKILSEIEKYTMEPIHSETQTTKEVAMDFSKQELGGSLGVDYFSIFENRNGVHFMHSWNRENSALWELRKLRNEITHGPFFKTGGERGTVRSRDALIIPMKHGAEQPYEMAFIFNPHDYFSNSLNLVSNHVNEILTLISDQT